MAGQNDSYHSNKPEPLPDTAIKAVWEGLERCGFEKRAIEKNYHFTSGTSLITVNALAFAHPSQRDLADFASVLVYNADKEHSDSELVTRLSPSSAPFYFIHRDDKFSIWLSNVTTEQKKSRIDPILMEQFVAHDRLEEVLNRYRYDLKPEHIADVKKGRSTFKFFPDVSPLQLSLWYELQPSKPLPIGGKMRHWRNCW